MTQETKVTQQAEAIADGWLALGPAFRTKEILVDMIENELASTEAADALRSDWKRVRPFFHAALSGANNPVDLRAAFDRIDTHLKGASHEQG